MIISGKFQQEFSFESFPFDSQRIKINLRITDQDLSNESIKVSLFKQSYDGSRWIDKGQDIDQALKVRESILNEARSLKIAAEL